MCQLLCYCLSAPNSPFYMLFEVNRDCDSVNPISSFPAGSVRLKGLPGSHGKNPEELDGVLGSQRVSYN